MKPLTSLLLSLALILAPVLAVGKRADAPDLDAKCRDQGGCFVVSEDGFKKAMLIAFDKGRELGKKECRGAM